MKHKINTDIYNKNYLKLEKLGFLNVFEKEYITLKSSGFMDLVLEKLYKNTMSLTHYYEMNGDLVRDPDIVVKIDINKKECEVLEYQDFYSYKRVYDDEGNFNDNVKIELNCFLNYFLNNLEMQGFKYTK